VFSVPIWEFIYSFSWPGYDLHEFDKGSCRYELSFSLALLGSSHIW
jgi:hypothetical protein